MSRLCSVWAEKNENDEVFIFRLKILNFEFRTLKINNETFLAKIT